MDIKRVEGLREKKCGAKEYIYLTLALPRILVLLPVFYKIIMLANFIFVRGTIHSSLRIHRLHTHHPKLLIMYKVNKLIKKY